MMKSQFEEKEEIKSIFSPGLDKIMPQSTKSHKSYDEKKRDTRKK